MAIGGAFRRILPRAGLARACNVADCYARRALSQLPTSRPFRWRSAVLSEPLPVRTNRERARQAYGVRSIRTRSFHGFSIKPAGSSAFYDHEKRPKPPLATFAIEIR